jgi:hypothetical protein
MVEMLLKDGETPYTDEHKRNATLISVETPAGNFIVVNDAICNMQGCLLKAKDYARIEAIHKHGGNIVELLFTPALVGGAFNDMANDFNFYPKLELVEDPCKDEYVGNIIFINKDLKNCHTLIPVCGDEKQYVLLDTHTLEAKPIAEEDECYRIVIRILPPELVGKEDVDIDTLKLSSVDILKAICIDVGPITEVIDDTEEEKED